MTTLADTGILLRLMEPTDPDYGRVRLAVDAADARGDRLVYAAQNAAEFWNVCTRPTSARGGLGLTLTEADRRLQVIEKLFSLLDDSPAAYPEWRRLVVALSVQGKQVHDARLVALMTAHGITHILTLNPADFARYPGTIAVTP